MIDKSMVNLDEPRGRIGSRVRYVLFGLGVLMVLSIFGLGAWQFYRASRPDYEPGAMPVSTEIEDKFGVRFTFVAVTAKGGMVELRYRVIDEGKAANFGHYSETAPMLIAEDTGKVVDVTIMGLHNHRVEPGRMYYILYRNTDNAIVSNRPVSIAVGDLKLENVVAW